MTHFKFPMPPVVIGACIALTACETMSAAERACRGTELATKSATVSNMENWLEQLDGETPDEANAPPGYTLAYLPAKYETSKSDQKSDLDECMDMAIEPKECEIFFVAKGVHKSDVTRQLTSPPRLRLANCSGKPMKHWLVEPREDVSGDI
ncbi:MAG: hypothetical protein ACPGVT_14065 [Maricaulaceae bacterium]